MGQIVQRIPFPHQSIGPFISCLKNYFYEKVHPFNYVVTGTYQKAIQLIEQKKNQPEITKMGNLSPILVFTPQLTEPVSNLDFDWKYSNLSPYLVRLNQQPIFEHNGNMLSVITRRMAGIVDFKVFCDSMMEMHDIYFNILDAFRGLNRITLINFVRQYLVVPSEITLFTDEHNTIAINWEDTTLNNIYFPGINKDKFYLPMHTVPFITLQSASDSSAFLGGDGLPDYSLQGTISFELEVPALLVLETAMRIIAVDATIGTTYAPDIIGMPPANDPGLTDSNNEPIIPVDGEVVIGPTDGYGNPTYPYQKGFVGISGDELQQLINIMFVERKLDDNTTKTEIGRVLKEYLVEVDVQNMTIEYPYVIPDIPWDVTKDNTLIFIANVYQEDWDVVDEHSIIMNSGKPYTNTMFEVRLYRFEEMSCRGRGK